jgi:sulfonate transport system permease protein
MRRSTYLLLAASGLVLFLLIWELLPRLGVVSPTLLPPPSVLPEAFVSEVRQGFWLRAVGDSFRHYLVGLSVGTALGVALGVLAALAPRFEAATAWLVRLLRPVPGLAWVPFAIIWFGITEAGAIFIIVVGVLWINFFLLEVADAFGHRAWPAKLVKIVLPAAAAGILGGMRTGLGQGWMSVVAAELFGIPGLGSRMMNASSLLATEVVVVYMITIAALYGITDSLFGLFRDRVLAWQK